jgi:hypothetical protein
MPISMCLVFMAANLVDFESSSPLISSVFPPGVTVGAEALVEIRGRGLNDVNQFHLSGSGIDVDRVKVSNNAVTIRLRAGQRAAPGFRELRVEGPAGISNLALVRVDPLPQSEEREPNDRCGTANPLPPNRAVAGRLTAGDCDHFLVEAKTGDRLTIEVEARRLGIPIAPVVTVMTIEGTPIHQARETPGIERDCRFSFTVPAPGRFVIQVRNNLYGGAEGAYYRLRVTDQPFATAHFPLGGPKGKTIIVTASGGILDSPIRQSVALPDEPGTTIDVPPFPGGVLIEGSLAVGNGPEVMEPSGSRDALVISAGVTVNGRVEKPAEVDRYRLAVKSGDQIRVRVTAAALGSWLDSVVTVRDAHGHVLAQNDDAPSWIRKSSGSSSTDSQVDLIARADEDLVVEVADRDLEGGPEFGYRLEVGPPRPELWAMMAYNPFNSSNPGNEKDRPAAAAPVSREAFTLRRGQTAALSINVKAEGLTGPITIAAEGLPPGVTAQPVVVERPPPAAANRAGRLELTAQLLIHAGKDAKVGSRKFRVVVHGESIEGEVVRSIASAVVRFDAVKLATPSVPVTRRVTEFFVKVVGP